MDDDATTASEHIPLNNRVHTTTRDTSPQPQRGLSCGACKKLKQQWTRKVDQYVLARWMGKLVFSREAG